MMLVVKLRNSIFILHLRGKDQVLEHEEVLDLLPLGQAHCNVVLVQFLAQAFVHEVVPVAVSSENSEAPLTLQRQRLFGQSLEFLQQRPLVEVDADAALLLVQRHHRRAGAEVGAELPQRLQDAFAGDLLAAVEHAAEHVLQQRTAAGVGGKHDRRVRLVQQQQTNALDGANAAGDAQRRVLQNTQCSIRTGLINIDLTSFLYRVALLLIETKVLYSNDQVF